MKRIAIWAVLGLVLAGCVVPSVYPFYFEKDLVFKEQLLGVWRDAKSDDNTKESWTFAKDGENAYLLTLGKETETNVVTVHFFKLKDKEFMDWLLVPDDGAVSIPAHYLFKVDQLNSKLMLSTMNPDWLKELLKKEPDAIRHTMAFDKPKPHEGTMPTGSSDEHIVLTADTKDLQKFVLKYCDDTNAFYAAFEMKKSGSN